jgi:hypothetical protein
LLSSELLWLDPERFEVRPWVRVAICFLLAWKSDA